MHSKGDHQNKGHYGRASYTFVWRSPSTHIRKGDAINMAIVYYINIYYLKV